MAAAARAAGRNRAAAAAAVVAELPVNVLIRCWRWHSRRRSALWRCAVARDSGTERPFAGCRCFPGLKPRAAGTVANPRVRFIDTAFPLIVTVASPKFDDAELRAVAEGFDRYFKRGERYALIWSAPRGAPPPSQQHRRGIADWANQPRVRDATKRLCVGTATVTQSQLMRASLSIIMAFWKPASPFKIVPSLESGLDYCLRRISDERLTMVTSPDRAKREMLELLKDEV